MVEERKKGETILEILISLSLLSIITVCVLSSYVFMRRMAAKAEKFIQCESLCLDLDKYYDSVKFETRYPASYTGSDSSYLLESEERQWANLFFKYQAIGTKGTDEIDIKSLLEVISEGLKEYNQDIETEESYKQRLTNGLAAQQLYDSYVQQFDIGESQLEAFNSYHQNETYLYSHYYDSQFKEIDPAENEKAVYILTYYYTIKPAYTYSKDGVYVFTNVYNLVVDIYNSDGMKILEDLNYGVAGKK